MNLLDMIFIAPQVTPPGCNAQDFMLWNKYYQLKLWNHSKSSADCNFPLHTHPEAYLELILSSSHSFVYQPKFIIRALAVT